ncbi:hypothetical protein BLNAU_886 [Blattamonas nauphoetae]|uniref:CPC1/SPEF2 domain-containing protein n=1 Tax=Blattamonas nauphoetae TaxID=2049346 RepID=A0ABQ9YL24_9EUKA|nr:hypothetical protein BLNAU_886 [Blattamonas nauphoetae]
MSKLPNPLAEIDEFEQKHVASRPKPSKVNIVATQPLDPIEHMKQIQKQVGTSEEHRQESNTFLTSLKTKWDDHDARRYEESERRRLVLDSELTQQQTAHSSLMSSFYDSHALESSKVEFNLTTRLAQVRNEKNRIKLNRQARDELVNQQKGREKENEFRRLLEQNMTVIADEENMKIETEKRIVLQREQDEIKDYALSARFCGKIVSDIVDMSMFLIDSRSESKQTVIPDQHLSTLKYLFTIGKSIPHSFASLRKMMKGYTPRAIPEYDPNSGTSDIPPFFSLHGTQQAVSALGVLQKQTEPEDSEKVVYDTKGSKLIHEIAESSLLKFKTATQDWQSSDFISHYQPPPIEEELPQQIPTITTPVAPNTPLKSPQGSTQPKTPKSPKRPPSSKTELFPIPSPSAQSTAMLPQSHPIIRPPLAIYPPEVARALAHLTFDSDLRVELQKKERKKNTLAARSQMTITSSPLSMPLLAAVIGPNKSGRSTLARHLSSALSLSIVTLDEAIARALTTHSQQEDLSLPTSPTSDRRDGSLKSSPKSTAFNANEDLLLLGKLGQIARDMLDRGDVLSDDVVCAIVGEIVFIESRKVIQNQRSLMLTLNAPATFNNTAKLETSSQAHDTERDASGDHNEPPQPLENSTIVNTAPQSSSVSPSITQRTVTTPRPPTEGNNDETENNEEKDDQKSEKESLESEHSEKPTLEQLLEQVTELTRPPDPPASIRSRIRNEHDDPDKVKEFFDLYLSNLKVKGGTDNDPVLLDIEDAENLNPNSDIVVDIDTSIIVDPNDPFSTPLDDSESRALKSVVAESVKSKPLSSTPQTPFQTLHTSQTPFDYVPPPKYVGGVVLDGFPRTMLECAKLEKILLHSDDVNPIIKIIEAEEEKAMRKRQSIFNTQEDENDVSTTASDSSLNSNIASAIVQETLHSKVAQTVVEETKQLSGERSGANSTGGTPSLVTEKKKTATDALLDKLLNKTNHHLNHTSPLSLNEQLLPMAGWEEDQAEFPLFSAFHCVFCLEDEEEHCVQRCVDVEFTPIRKEKMITKRTRKKNKDELRRERNHMNPDLPAVPRRRRSISQAPGKKPEPNHAHALLREIHKVYRIQPISEFTQFHTLTPTSMALYHTQFTTFQKEKEKMKNWFTLTRVFNKLSNTDFSSSNELCRSAVHISLTSIKLRAKQLEPIPPLSFQLEELPYPTEADLQPIDIADLDKQLNEEFPTLLRLEEEEEMEAAASGKGKGKARDVATPKGKKKGAKEEAPTEDEEEKQRLREEAIAQRDAEIEERTRLKAEKRAEAIATMCAELQESRERHRYEEIIHNLSMSKEKYQTAKTVVKGRKRGGVPLLRTLPQIQNKIALSLVNEFHSMELHYDQLLSSLFGLMPIASQLCRNLVVHPLHKAMDVLNKRDFRTDDLISTLQSSLCSTTAFPLVLRDHDETKGEMHLRLTETVIALTRTVSKTKAIGTHLRNNTAQVFSNVILEPIRSIFTEITVRVLNAEINRLIAILRLLYDYNALIHGLPPDTRLTPVVVLDQAVPDPKAKEQPAQVPPGYGDKFILGEGIAKFDPTFNEECEAKSFRNAADPDMPPSKDGEADADPKKGAKKAPAPAPKGKDKKAAPVPEETDMKEKEMLFGKVPFMGVPFIQWIPKQTIKEKGDKEKENEAAQFLNDVLAQFHRIAETATQQLTSKDPKVKGKEGTAAPPVETEGQEKNRISTLLQADYLAVGASAMTVIDSLERAIKYQMVRRSEWESEFDRKQLEEEEEKKRAAEAKENEAKEEASQDKTKAPAKTDKKTPATKTKGKKDVVEEPEEILPPPPPPFVYPPLPPALQSLCSSNKIWDRISNNAPSFQSSHVKTLQLPDQIHPVILRDNFFKAEHRDIACLELIQQTKQRVNGLVTSLLNQFSGFIDPFFEIPRRLDTLFKERLFADLQAVSTVRVMFGLAIEQGEMIRERVRIRGGRVLVDQNDLVTPSKEGIEDIEEGMSENAGVPGLSQKLSKQQHATQFGIVNEEEEQTWTYRTFKKLRNGDHSGLSWREFRKLPLGQTMVELDINPLGERVFFKTPKQPKEVADTDEAAPTGPHIIGDHDEDQAKDPTLECHTITFLQAMKNAPDMKSRQEAEYVRKRWNDLNLKCSAMVCDQNQCRPKGDEEHKDDTNFSRFDKRQAIIAESFVKGTFTANLLGAKENPPPNWNSGPGFARPFWTLEWDLLKNETKPMSATEKRRRRQEALIETRTALPMYSHKKDKMSMAGGHFSSSLTHIERPHSAKSDGRTIITGSQQKDKLGMAVPLERKELFAFSHWTDPLHHQTFDPPSTTIKLMAYEWFGSIPADCIPFFEKIVELHHQHLETTGCSLENDNCKINTSRPPPIEQKVVPFLFPKLSPHHPLRRPYRSSILSPFHANYLRIALSCVSRSGFCSPSLFARVCTEVTGGTLQGSQYGTQKTATVTSPLSVQLSPAGLPTVFPPIYRRVPFSFWKSFADNSACCFDVPVSTDGENGCCNWKPHDSSQFHLQHSLHVDWRSLLVQLLLPRPASLHELKCLARLYARNTDCHGRISRRRFLALPLFFEEELIPTLTKGRITKDGRNEMNVDVNDNDEWEYERGNEGEYMDEVQRLVEERELDANTKKSPTKRNEEKKPKPRISALDTIQDGPQKADSDKEAEVVVEPVNEKAYVTDFVLVSLKEQRTRNFDYLPLTLPEEKKTKGQPQPSKSPSQPNQEAATPEPKSHRPTIQQVLPARKGSRMMSPTQTRAGVSDSPSSSSPQPRPTPKPSQRILPRTYPNTAITHLKMILFDLLAKTVVQTSVIPTDNTQKKKRHRHQHTHAHLKATIKLAGTMIRQKSMNRGQRKELFTPEEPKNNQPLSGPHSRQPSVVSITSKIGRSVGFGKDRIVPGTPVGNDAPTLNPVHLLKALSSDYDTIEGFHKAFESIGLFQKLNKARIGRLLHPSSGEGGPGGPSQSIDEINEQFRLNQLQPPPTDPSSNSPHPQNPDLPTLVPGSLALRRMSSFTRTSTFSTGQNPDGSRRPSLLPPTNPVRLTMTDIVPIICELSTLPTNSLDENKRKVVYSTGRNTILALLSSIIEQTGEKDLISWDEFVMTEEGTNIASSTKHYQFINFGDLMIKAQTSQ